MPSFQVSNCEGRDFEQNMYTARVNYGGGRVHTAYVRYKAEEIDQAVDEWELVRETALALVRANEVGH